MIIHLKFSLVGRLQDVPNYDPKESSVEIGPDMPKIPFKKLDNALQRKFYKFCPPVLLRDLFDSSKAMKEIKRPSTYVSWDTLIEYNTTGVNSVKPDPSAVIEVRDALYLFGLKPGDFSRYLGGYKFHHDKLKLRYTVLSPEEFKIIVNPSITHVYLDDHCFSGDQTLEMYLESMPYLEWIQYNSDHEISDLASTLFNWQQKSKLESIKLHCPVPSIKNFLTHPKLFAKFMNDQEENFSIEIENSNTEDEDINHEIRKYFFEGKILLPKSRSLVFMDLSTKSIQRILYPKATHHSDRAHHSGTGKTSKWKAVADFFKI